MKKTYLAAGRGVHAVSACFRCLFLIPIFVLGCFGAHAAAQTQQSVSRVSLDVRDAAIVNVFQTVQQQTGCSFVYNTSDIDTDRKVTVSAQDEPLTALLDKLFAGSDIAYTLRDKHIVLSKKTKNSPPHNAQGGVSGTVKDAQGMPLIGATVLIQGTTTGVAVDLDGNFSLPQAKKPENAVEKEYQNLAEMLGRQWENARQEARCQISEANRYYIRWSHQIKTPIAALRLLLEEEEPDRAAMEGEIYRIEQYVEFALQYQRLEGGHKDLVFAHYSLESIVKKALKKTGVLFRRTKLALELGNLQTDVLTDEKWLVFVLEQVLTNAVKYTRKGKISIYLDPEKEKTLVVEDTGMGIRPEDLPRIFEWGYTGYNGRIKNRATGIGLALCRQTMEMLGHRISAKSEPGKGTCIYLDLAVDPVRDY